ncbi:mannose-ethanolamine phosphotransferase gpi13 [Physocladia obscura]|uniref:Mannose-ethanolamine phosphotransferase gpi13 n=1 Tax=Physocladia obscura TaxID=109957 RepID=A0AAD5SR78_9FUNG|nr:mannose-ethanolamine phosphotransferase gpi13 [Physocladia obscura]
MKDSSSHSPLSFSQWFLGLSLLILWAGVPASDSFTIYEESVTVHLLQTFGLYMVVIGINSRHPAVQNTIVLNSVLFMILTRVSQTSTVCREEKAQTCFPTFNALPNSSVASPFAVLGLIVLIPVVLITVRRALSSTDSLHGTGYFIVTYSLPAGLFVSFVYWLLDTLHGYQQFVGGWEFMQTIKIWWAKVLFLACSVSALYVWGCEPSCLGVAELTITAQTPTKTGTAAAENNNRDGSILVDKATQKEYVILGLQNPLGSAYLVFVSIVYMILAMFQKPMGGVMLGIQIIQIVGLVEIYTLLRDEWEPNLGLESSFVTMQAKLFQSAHTSSPSESANPEKSSNKFREEGKKPTPFSLLFLFTVVLLIQGQRFFFATGHQYTLASIQWDVAFIGLFNTSFVWGPVIMLFNTFGAPLLSLLAIPLLPLWKQRRDVVALAGSGNGSGNKSRDHVILRDIGAVFLIVGLCLGVWGFAATAFVGHFRRHLMVWSVFAPKFLGVDMGVIVLEGFLILFVGAAVARVWMLK